MSKVPFVKDGDGVITVLVKGQAFHVSPDQPNYKTVREALKDATEDQMFDLLDVKKAMSAYTKGRVEIKGDLVYYNGEQVHGTIATRIIDFMRDGLPFEPLIAFLSNAMKNPSMKSRKQIYDFLEHRHLPVTEDGCFLAYKAVRKDYMDKYKGVFRNSPGDVVTMTRSDIDDDSDVGCSKGLHVGALDYVASYGSVNSGDRIVIVKVNPADVVSVPKDCSYQKVRTCKYEVVGEYEGELLKPLYSAEFSQDEYHDEDEDEDDYDWGWSEEDEQDEEECEDDCCNDCGCDSEDDEDEEDDGEEDKPQSRRWW